MTGAALCVLSSSSSGNCSALLLTRGDGSAGLVLIDAGLSPRRTRALLREAGLEGVEPEAVVFTHLDRDHFHPGWPACLPGSTRVFVHARHRGRAGREGLLNRRTEVFTESLDLGPGVKAWAGLMAHDDGGASAFRIEPEGCGSLGYATDVGRPSAALVDLLRGVDVLAIESNYCPVMQVESSRPEFLKVRIMGGRGHLSNAESARAVREIGPRVHLVLLHLSRQCNHPERAARAHAGCSRPTTIASADCPTGWIRLESGVERVPPVAEHLWAC